MKLFTLKVITMLVAVAALAGCAGIQQESAMDWMNHQPVLQDD